MIHDNLIYVYMYIMSHEVPWKVPWKVPVIFDHHEIRNLSLETMLPPPACRQSPGRPRKAPVDPLIFFVPGSGPDMSG